MKKRKKKMKKITTGDTTTEGFGVKMCCCYVLRLYI